MNFLAEYFKNKLTSENFWDFVIDNTIYAGIVFITLFLLKKVVLVILKKAGKGAYKAFSYIELEKIYIYREIINRGGDMGYLVGYTYVFRYVLLHIIYFFLTVSVSTLVYFMIYKNNLVIYIGAYLSFGQLYEAGSWLSNKWAKKDFSNYSEEVVDEMRHLFKSIPQKEDLDV